MNSPSSSTHFSFYLGTFSSIDLTICSPILKIYFKWKTLKDLHSSDHFPIALQLNTTKVIERRPKWKVSDADWTSYQLDINMDDLNTSDNCNERNSFLVETITRSANNYVPRTPETPKRCPIPWFSDEIKEALKARRKALALLNGIRLIFFFQIYDK